MKQISETELIYLIEKALSECEDTSFLANNISADENSQKSFLNLICLEFALGVEKSREIYEYRNTTLGQCLTWIFDQQAREMGIGQRASSLFGAEDVKIVESLVEADSDFKETLKRIGDLCERKEYNDLVDILKAKYHSACADINSEKYNIPNAQYKIENAVESMIRKNAAQKISIFLSETKELPSVLPLYERYLETYSHKSVFEMCEVVSEVKRRFEETDNAKKGYYLENQVLAKSLMAHLQAQVLVRMINLSIPPGGPSERSEQAFLSFANTLAPIEIHCLLPIMHVYVKESTAQKLADKYSLLHYSEPEKK